MEGVEKSVFVCKLLLDQRVIELKKENESLKVQIFWKTYNPTKLKEAMVHGNQGMLGPKCGCTSCVVTGRCGEEASNIAGPCTFKTWFEQKIMECGMTIGCGIDGMRDGAIVDDPNPVYDVDCHFNSLARQDWFCWSYGSRLWRAKSASNPELAKLVALFKVLENDGLDDEGI